MLFYDDVMGHREAEPCPVSGRFGGEEGIEHLFSHLGRDAGTVVANTDFDCLAKVPGGSSENRLKDLIVACFYPTFVCGVEAVGNQV